MKFSLFSMLKFFLFCLCFVLLQPNLQAQFFGTLKTWDGGGDGISWSDPQNWNPTGVPGGLSAVFINNGDAVRLDISATVRSISVDLFSSLEVRQDLQVNGNLSISGTAKLFWRSNRIQARRIINNGLLQLSSAGDKVLGATTFVENNAAINIFGTFFGTGHLLVEDNATIQNNFQINVQGPNADLLVQINNDPLTTRLINNGSLRRKKPIFGGGGSTIVALSLENNFGNIISEGGSLLLQGHNLFLGAKFQAETVDADIQIRGTSNRASGLFSGFGEGRVRLMQDLQVINNGILLSFLRGGFYWERRIISGTSSIRNIGNLFLVSPENKTLASGMSLVNQGLCSISDGTPLGGNLVLSNNTSFDNQSTLEVNGANTDILRAFNNNTNILLRNTGTIRKRGTPLDGLATINVPFENEGGTIEVQTGVLDVRNGGRMDGLRFNGSVLGELRLTNFSFAASGDIFSGNGLGRFVLQSDLQVNGQVAFDFPKEVFRWTRGSMIGGNILNQDHMQLVSDGTLGTNNKIIAASAQFSNMGTLLLRDGQPNGRNLILADSSILINEATISFEGDQADLVQAGTGNRILNFGTINKTQGQGLSNINVRLENSRTLDVQSGTLAFGETFIHQTGAILQGQANFDLPISNDFTNLGITNPGDITTTARLTFLGDYKLPPNAQLSIDVNGPVPISQYDQVQVTGTATLEGAIALNLNYTPSCQDTLRILQAGQITNCSLPDTLFASLGSSFVPYLVDCRSDAVLLIPQLQELCGDGIDNDCDGQIDEGCTIPLRQPQSVAQVQPEEWQVFPNPVRDVLHLKFTAQSIPSGRLLLTNSLGQQVEGWKLSGQGLSSSFSLQIGHLAAGLYTLSWEQSGIVSSKRIKILPR